MARWSRFATLLFGAAILVLWVALGAHRGWTRDSRFREIPDPVTGLVQYVPEDTWIPGVDFLALGLGSAAAAFCLTLVHWKQLMGKEG